MAVLCINGERLWPIGYPMTPNRRVNSHMVSADKVIICVVQVPAHHGSAQRASSAA